MGDSLSTSNDGPSYGPIVMLSDATGPLSSPSTNAAVIRCSYIITIQCNTGLRGAKLQVAAHKFPKTWLSIFDIP